MRRVASSKERCTSASGHGARHRAAGLKTMGLVGAVQAVTRRAGGCDAVLTMQSAGTHNVRHRCSWACTQSFGYGHVKLQCLMRRGSTFHTHLGAFQVAEGCLVQLQILLVQQLRPEMRSVGQNCTTAEQQERPIDRPKDGVKLAD